MTKFNELKAEHQRLLDQHDAGKDEAALLASAQAYIDQIRVASEQVSDPRDRDQLRAYLRFWGAYIYDQTGTYPETSLRPAPQMEAPPANFWARWNRRWLFAGTVGVIFILAILCLMILGPVIGGGGDFPEIISETPAQDAETSTPVPPSQTSAIEPEGPTSVRSSHTPTATSTSTIEPSPTTTPTPDATKVPLTATLSALMTQIAHPSSMTPTRFPNTEEGFERLQFIAEVGNQMAAGWCTARYLEISLIPEGDNTTPNSSIPVWVQRTGEARIALQTELKAGAAGTRLDLAARQIAGPGQFLLHLEHPDATASDLIFEYNPDCRSEQLTVKYQLVKTESDLDAEPARNPELALVWRLVTWGPEPQGFSGDPRWFAVFDLVGQGGDGAYLFWQADEYGYLEPLDNNQVIVRGWACQPGRLIVGTTSAGQALTRELVVQAPYCPEK